jgi:hypothetical protein
MENSLTTGTESSSPKNRTGAIKARHASILKWNSLKNIAKKTGSHSARTINLN